MSGILELPNLSSTPRNEEFEELVSAFFNSAGYYVEKNIIDREITEIEVLELDVITTEYMSPDASPTIRLVEVKSGNWGFPDIFKIRGWMDYLNIDEGLFIVQEKKEETEFKFLKRKQVN